jgi:hypothetical protein
MTDVAEDTTQLQNAVRSFLSAMEPEESVTFASLVYFYNGRQDVHYNGRILCPRVAPVLSNPGTSLLTLSPATKQFPCPPAYTLGQ